MTAVKLKPCGFSNCSLASYYVVLRHCRQGIEGTADGLSEYVHTV